MVPSSRRIFPKEARHVACLFASSIRA
jgi:hypothetical protein